MSQVIAPLHHPYDRKYNQANSCRICGFSTRTMKRTWRIRSLLSDWLIVILLVFVHATPVSGSNDTSVNGTTTTPATVDGGGDSGGGGLQPIENDTLPKSLIAVAILAGAVIIGAVVAKLVDFIHDRKSLQDDASDMSEYTRVLLKKRFAVLAFTKDGKNPNSEDEYPDGSGVKLPPELAALKLGKQWSFRATQRRQQRERSLSLAVSSQADVEKGQCASDIDDKTSKTGSGTNMDLLSYTVTSGSAIVTDIVTTSCEIGRVDSNMMLMAGSTMSISELVVPPSPKILTSRSSLQRIPSFTVDELEDDVFMEEVLNPKRTAVGRTPTPSMIARVQVSEEDIAKGNDKNKKSQKGDSNNKNKISGQTHPSNDDKPLAVISRMQTPDVQPSPAQALAEQMAAPRPTTAKARRGQSPSPRSSATNAAAGAWLFTDGSQAANDISSNSDLAPVHKPSPSCNSTTTEGYHDNSAFELEAGMDTAVATTIVDATPTKASVVVTTASAAANPSSSTAVVSIAAETTMAADSTTTRQKRAKSPLPADMPERPRNPEPPLSNANSRTVSPARTMTPVVVDRKTGSMLALVAADADFDDDGVVYSCDAKRAVTGSNKNRTVGVMNKSTVSKANKVSSSANAGSGNHKNSNSSSSTFTASRADFKKIFHRATSAKKRPQTAKKATSGNSGSSAAVHATSSRATGGGAGGGGVGGGATSSSSAAGVSPRPKTAGPVQSSSSGTTSGGNNRPVSAKSSRKITPGGRLKSAKK